MQVGDQGRFLHEAQPRDIHKPRGGKKKLFALKRQAGTHQILIWNSDNSCRGLWVKAVGAKLSPPPAPSGNDC